MRPFASAADYEQAARRRLPRFLYDYISGGSYDEQTLRANRERLQAIGLNQRVMRDVAGVETATSLLGQSATLPIALGPVGLAGMCARRGEVQAALAAQAAGVPFCLSAVSLCGLAEVAATTDTPFWFQLYMVRDRGFLAELLQEAARHCSALLFTVDMPVASTRYRDFRSGMSGAPGLAGALRRGLQAAARPGWAWDVGLRGRPHSLGNLRSVVSGRGGTEDFVAWIGRNFDPAVTWKDLDFVRRHWTGPLAIKGVLDPDDAAAAADAGAEGIVVSNHGGRQMDGVPATCDALPAIADRVGDRMTVLVDGGVRSGIDVLRMLALGAHGVLIGRAWAYALAADGERGVRNLIAGLERELRAGMAMTGCPELADVGRVLGRTGPAE